MTLVLSPYEFIGNGAGSAAFAASLRADWGDVGVNADNSNSTGGSVVDADAEDKLKPFYLSIGKKKSKGKYSCY